MTWQQEMKDALVGVLINKGTPVDNTPGNNLYYGYIAYDYEELRKHMKSCAPDLSKCSYKDVEWTEFAGTFAESDDRKTGIEVTVTCQCGEVDGRKWRYTEGYAELIQAITDTGI